MVEEGRSYVRNIFVRWADGAAYPPRHSPMVGFCKTMRANRGVCLAIVSEWRNRDVETRGIFKLRIDWTAIGWKFPTISLRSS